MVSFCGMPRRACGSIASNPRNVQGQGRAGEIDEIAFSPQIDELAARYNDGKLIVWDFATGNEFPMPAINPPPNMMFMRALDLADLCLHPAAPYWR